jgi:hypothetical protein
MYAVQAMSKSRAAAFAGFVFSTVTLTAQGPVINRLPPATMRGVVVETTCFRQQGAATVTSVEQIGCAKKRVAEGGKLGLLTEGDGLFQITGPFADNKYAKLVAYIGKTVEMTGAEVTISNNYEYRSFEAQKVTAAKK